MTYEVQIDNFQGPLELLYQLVKKNEIEINKISLAKITGQYLEYLEQLQKFNLDTASEFMVIASELIEIKAGNILPGNEDEEKEDNKNDLVQRLQEYQLFKNISSLLKEYEATSHLYAHPVRFEKKQQLKLDLSPSCLQKAFYEAYKTETEDNNDNTDQETIEYLKTEKIRVQDKVEEIMDQLQQSSSGLGFDRLLVNKNNQMEIVVTLLSILELIKLSKVTVKQDNLFTKIKIWSKTGKTEQVV